MKTFSLSQMTFKQCEIDTGDKADTFCHFTENLKRKKEELCGCDCDNCHQKAEMSIKSD